ncbi:MAG: hypothetical protein AB1847_15785, partial [bacterium]
DLTTAHKSKVIMDAMSKSAIHCFICKIPYGQHPLFVPLPEDRLNYLQDLAQADLAWIMDRCIHPCYKAFFPPLMQNGEVLTNKKQASPSSGSSLSSQAFQIITTSIIRC